MLVEIEEGKDCTLSTGRKVAIAPSGEVEISISHCENREDGYRETWRECDGWSISFIDFEVYEVDGDVSIKDTLSKEEYQECYEHAEGILDNEIDAHLERYMDMYEGD